MDKEKIANNISTNKVINKLIYFDEIKSTQSYAKNNIDNIKDGTIILADNQTAGYGTHGRTWVSEKDNNLTFTIVLKPENKNIKNINGLTTYLAETMTKTISELYEITSKIKLPNDIKINDKKVAGILTESSTEGEKISYILIGIGFNINQERFKNEIKQIATSMYNETKIKKKREDVLTKLISNIEKIIEKI